MSKDEPRGCHAWFQRASKDKLRNLPGAVVPSTVARPRLLSLTRKSTTATAQPSAILASLRGRPSSAQRRPGPRRLRATGTGEATVPSPRLVAGGRVAHGRAVATDFPRRGAPKSDRLCAAGRAPVEGRQRSASESADIIVPSRGDCFFGVRATAVYGGGRTGNARAGARLRRGAKTR